MAREMRQARSRAHQGDIFTPALQVYFRTLIAETLRREGITDLLAIVDDENFVHTPARVNGDYPAGRSIPAIPPCILTALPTLPPEVRYSFVGRDLILWDMHAGLIVDFAASRGADFDHRLNDQSNLWAVDNPGTQFVAVANQAAATAERPSGRTVRTGQAAWRRIGSVVVPNTMRSIGFRPWIPSTIRSLFSSAATLKIWRYTRPLRISNSGVASGIDSRRNPFKRLRAAAS